MWIVIRTLSDGDDDGDGVIEIDIGLMVGDFFSCVYFLSINKNSLLIKQ